MRTVTGRCDGRTIVLDEPVPVQGTVEVSVTFPDRPGLASEPPVSLLRYWDDATSVYLRFVGTASDEVLRQRGRFDVTPSGLPEYMPSDEDWKQRAARINGLLSQWQSEEPSADLATWEELSAGLDESPVKFREVTLDV